MYIALPLRCKALVVAKAVTGGWTSGCEASSGGYDRVGGPSGRRGSPPLQGQARRGLWYRDMSPSRTDLLAPPPPRTWDVLGATWARRPEGVCRRLAGSGGVGSAGPTCSAGVLHRDVLRQRVRLLFAVRGRRHVLGHEQHQRRQPDHLYQRCAALCPAPPLHVPCGAGGRGSGDDGGDRGGGGGRPIQGPRHALGLWR